MVKYAGLQNGQVAYGSVKGTGAAVEIVIGFKPRHVKVINPDSDSQIEWLEGMAGASGMKTYIDTGDAKFAFVSNGGITQGERGFTIGNDADVNVDDEDLFFIAIG